MNRHLKTYLIVIASIIVGGGAFTYGALTAPKKPETIKTTAITSQKPIPSKKPEKIDLKKQLQTELPAITSALTAAYPQVSTDYTINPGNLYDKGQWFGTTLTYKGSDTDNRDTLRVLLQKKNNIWIVRTTPPQPLLSTAEFPDVPKSILQSINKPISLPAGAENSPVITVNE